MSLEVYLIAISIVLFVLAAILDGGRDGVRPYERHAATFLAWLGLSLQGLVFVLLILN